MGKSMDDIYAQLEKVRRMGKRGRLCEGKTSGNGDMEGVVPYTSQDELMTNITETCKSQFGADFSKSDTPMLYYEMDGDVTLSGEIPMMNDAKFQFRYKDSSGTGCYIWLSPLPLTDENIRTLSVINGVCKNWKKDLSTAEDIKPMGYKGSTGAKPSGDSGGGASSVNERRVRRGDDILSGGWGCRRGDDIP